MFRTFCFCYVLNRNNNNSAGDLLFAHLAKSPKLQEQHCSFYSESSMYEARKKLDARAGAGLQLNGR